MSLRAKMERCVFHGFKSSRAAVTSAFFQNGRSHWARRQRNSHTLWTTTESLPVLPITHKHEHKSCTTPAEWPSKQIGFAGWHIKQHNAITPILPCISDRDGIEILASRISGFNTKTEKCIFWIWINSMMLRNRTQATCLWWPLMPPRDVTT